MRIKRFRLPLAIRSCRSTMALGESVDKDATPARHPTAKRVLQAPTQGKQE